MKNEKKELGMVIVEATIVFPIMFIIVLAMIFLGNLYLQKCKVSEIVSETVIKGTSYCTDPLLSDIYEAKKNNGDANFDIKSMNIYPYRYVLGNMRNIEGKLENEISTKLNKMGSGLLFGMEPKIKVCDVTFNNDIVYSTLSANVRYKIELPIKMIGEEENLGATLSVNVEMPVSDSVEFMRNMDMVDDYMQRSKTVQKLKEALSKAMEWVK